nr:hypothetical protein [Tanacetum cinerariifolium]
IHSKGIILADVDGVIRFSYSSNTPMIFQNQNRSTPESSFPFRKVRSRPDIMFATCMCARYQANSNEHHVTVVKKIFRYLKGIINLGLWYSKDSGFDLTAYSDATHAGCHLDRKSTPGSVQFLGDKLVCWSSKKQNYASISTVESEYVAVSAAVLKCCGCVLN